MPQTNFTLSHRFIAALDSQRDQVWAMATAPTPEAGTEGAAAQLAVTTGKIEATLHAAIREAFAAVEKDQAQDPWHAMQQALAARGITSPPPAPAQPAGDASAAPVAPTAMPADVWARLVADVQVQAARSAHTRAINPDSVLLSPDPLLAPRKITAPDDAEGFDLSPSSRFMLAAVIAVIIGIGLTIYLLTRPTAAPPATQRGGNTTGPATTITSAPAPAPH
jgi:hypothetical protein